MILVAIATAPRAATIDVGFEGAGAGCEAVTLVEAIDIADNSSAADEIRLRQNVQYAGGGTLHLTDWGPTGKGNLTISGGYSSCTDTTGTGPPSGITFSGPGPVVEVDTTGASTAYVIFENMTIGGSTGRGILAQGNSLVDLLGSAVFFNGGGGIQVESGSSVYLDADSGVYLNGPTTLGGGIFCTGSTSEVLIEALIGDGNEATSGGGIAIVAGCEAVLMAGARIFDNTATFGGGVWADSGALVSALSGDVVIDYNDASSSGGGIGANGSGTQVLLAGTAISLNTAGFWGAGIYANASALVSLAAHGSPCGSYFDCPGFLSFNNLVGSGQLGVAAVAANGAEVRLKKTLVRRNAVPESATSGSVLYAEAGGALINTESVQVSGNQWVRSAFHGKNNGDIRIAMTTTAFNFQETTPALWSEGVRLEGTGSQGWINTSIMYPVDSYVVNTGGAFVSVDCVITSTTTGLVGTFITVADPLYQNEATGDLHLRRGSPAIDYCDDVVFSPTVAGLDGLPRGIDDPFDPNGMPGVDDPGAVYDLGAFPLGLIFTDGFESGDTSRWSG